MSSPITHQVRLVSGHDLAVPLCNQCHQTQAQLQLVSESPQSSSYHCGACFETLYHVFLPQEMTLTTALEREILVSRNQLQVVHFGRYNSGRQPCFSSALLVDRQHLAQLQHELKGARSVLQFIQQRNISLLNARLQWARLQRYCLPDGCKPSTSTQIHCDIWYSIYARSSLLRPLHNRWFGANPPSASPFYLALVCTQLFTELQDCIQPIQRHEMHEVESSGGLLNVQTRVNRIVHTLREQLERFVHAPRSSASSQHSYHLLPPPLSMTMPAAGVSNVLEDIVKMEHQNHTQTTTTQMPLFQQPMDLHNLSGVLSSFYPPQSQHHQSSVNSPELGAAMAAAYQSYQHAQLQPPPLEFSAPESILPSLPLTSSYPGADSHGMDPAHIFSHAMNVPHGQDHTSHSAVPPTLDAGARKRARERRRQKSRAAGSATGRGNVAKISEDIVINHIPVPLVALTFGNEPPLPPGQYTHSDGLFTYGFKTKLVK